MRRRAAKDPARDSERYPHALTERIEGAIEGVFAALEHSEVPPRLRAAMQHAVFPAGGRIRPHLCLAAAVSCGDGDPRLADAAAVAVELLHCASLVHDDMPAFDNASVRRGRPSVHAAFGEQLALLAGDGLIVLAFETLARAETDSSRRSQVTVAIAQGVGARSGIVAGQAWESEPAPDISAYHHAKTAALFEAAAAAGALAGGGEAGAWGELGMRLGRAYQLADDIADWLGDSDTLGKPTGQDHVHGRPNAIHHFGPDEVEATFASAVRAVFGAIPSGEHAAWLRPWVERALGRLLPESTLAKLRQASADLSPSGLHEDGCSE